jgi:hypothetical protein
MNADGYRLREFAHEWRRAGAGWELAVQYGLQGECS